MSSQSVEICGENVVNIDLVKKIKENIPADNDISALSETFKVLGDPTRLRIVLGLARSEMCVCDLATLVGISVSAISHQLRILRNLKLVKFRKEGKMVYYSLDDEHIELIIGQALNHVKE